MLDEIMDCIEGHKGAAKGKHGVDSSERHAEGGGRLPEGSRETNEMGTTGTHDSERKHEDTCIDDELEDLPRTTLEQRRQKVDGKVQALPGGVARPEETYPDQEVASQFVRKCTRVIQHEPREDLPQNINDGQPHERSHDGSEDAVHMCFQARHSEGRVISGEGVESAAEDTSSSRGCTGASSNGVRWTRNRFVGIKTHNTRSACRIGPQIRCVALARMLAGREGIAQSLDA